MSVKVFTATDLAQSSSWTWADGELTSGPSISTNNKSFNFSTIPAGSTINTAVLTASYSTTAYRLRQVEGAAFSGSRNVKAKVTAGGSASIEFKFQGSGSTGGTMVGSSTSWLTWSNIKITVDYTEPASALTLNKTSCKSGDTIRGTITPASSTASHKMRFYQDASHYYEYTLAAGTNYKDFEIPLAWQNQIPNATTDTITVRLQTYLSGSLTGEVSKTFTMTLSDDNYPTISAFTATRIPGFTDEDITGYVQGYSKANFDATAAGLYGATISQYRFYTDAWSVTGNDSDSPILTTSGVRTVTCEVTDSRGRKTTSTLEITVIPYAPPSLDMPTVYRCDVAGVAAIAGTYVYIDSGIAFSSLGLVEGVEINEATLKSRVYQKGGIAPAWDDISVINMTPETPEIESGMSISLSYTIDFQITDKLATYLYSTEIPTAKALLTGLAGVVGAGIGLYAERENALTVAWPIFVNDEIIGLRRNELHNWDFRTPVNQRTVTGTISTAGYFYDRWLLNSGSVTTNAAYLTVDGVIEQRIEGHLLAGLTLTASVEVGGAVSSGFGVMPSSAGEDTIELDIGDITLGYHTDYLYLRFTPDSAVNVSRIKLEVGNYSTLEADPPMEYQTELIKCQRFFQSCGSTPLFYGVTLTSSTARLMIHLPCTMRILPSLSAAGSSCRGPGVVAADLTAVTISPNGALRLLATATSGSFTTNLVATGYSSADPLYLSADL